MNTDRLFFFCLLIFTFGSHFLPVLHVPVFFLFCLPLSVLVFLPCFFMCVFLLSFPHNICVCAVLVPVFHVFHLPCFPWRPSFFPSLMVSWVCVVPLPDFRGFRVSSFFPSLTASVCVLSSFLPSSMSFICAFLFLFVFSHPSCVRLSGVPCISWLSALPRVCVFQLQAERGGGER